MSRYTTTTPFTVTDMREVTTSDDTPVAVIVETADIVDSRTNHRYRDGRYRVRVAGPGGGWPRAKTFTGETAWCAARAHADALTRTLQR